MHVRLIGDSELSPGLSVSVRGGMSSLMQTILCSLDLFFLLRLHVLYIYIYKLYISHILPVFLVMITANEASAEITQLGFMRC